MCFQLLDELQKELEELRRYKIDSEKHKSLRSRNPSLTDSNGYTTLQSEMAKLRDVSMSLVFMDGLNEPSHEIMVLFILRKVILQTHIHIHPMGLDV